MSYIGKTPTTGDFKKCDAISTSATDTFNLLVSSVAVSPVSANHCIVSLNGVLQAPITAFTISGSTIIFASALTSSDVIDFIIILGNVNDIGVPSDDTITNAKLSSNLISGETDIGGALADADLILVDDGAGGTLRKSAMSRIKTYVGSGLEYADVWRLTGSFANSSGTNKITGTWEQSDAPSYVSNMPMGTGVTESSGTFTMPSTGYWLVWWQLTSFDSSSGYKSARIFNNNDQGLTQQYYYHTGVSDEDMSCFSQIVYPVTNTSSDQGKFMFKLQNSQTARGDTNVSLTCVGFVKLGDI